MSLFSSSPRPLLPSCSWRFHQHSPTWPSTCVVTRTWIAWLSRSWHSTHRRLVGFALARSRKIAQYVACVCVCVYVCVWQSDRSLATWKTEERLVRSQVLASAAATHSARTLQSTSIPVSLLDADHEARRRRPVSFPSRRNPPRGDARPRRPSGRFTTTTTTRDVLVTHLGTGNLRV